MKEGRFLLYSQISVGEDLLHSHFSGRKSYYIAIFPRGKIARGKGYYTTTVLWIRPYKPRSRVAVGVARIRTLTAKSHEVLICSLVTGNGDSLQIAEILLVWL
jgi:hypothetical protein